MGAFQSEKVPKSIIRTKLVLNAAKALLFDSYGCFPPLYDNEGMAPEQVSIPTYGGSLFLIEKRFSRRGLHTHFHDDLSGGMTRRET